MDEMVDAMAPIAYAPEEKPPEEKKRRAQERELERIRQIEEKRQNPFVAPRPREGGRTRQPKETAHIVQETPALQPQVPAPQSIARESAAPKQAAPAPVEQRQTKETTKVENFTLTHFNTESGKYEVQEGQNKVTYAELDKIERIEPAGAQEVEIEREKERAELRIEKTKPQIVKAIPLEQIISPVSPDEVRKREKEEREKKDAKIVVADSKREQPKEESADALTARIKHALDEAREHNRPGLVVQTILDKRETQGPLDLLQFDERSVRILEKELEGRIAKAKKERENLLTRIKSEKDANKKRALRVSLKKVLLNLAFYSKVKGMLSRVLGGFFGKLAGGLMKK